MRRAVTAIGFGLVAASAAAQPAGAPVGTATQAGAWGSRGWEPGAAPAPAPVAAAARPLDITAPAPGYAAPAAPPAPLPSAAVASAVPPHAYDGIEPGRRIKGPALGNTIYDYARWGLPAPGAGMRWIRWWDDAVLIDARDRAVDARSVAWNAPPQPVRRAAVAPPPAYVPPAAPQRAPGTYTERHGDTVTTTQVMAPAATVGQAWGGYGNVVSVTPGTVVTTTRTYTVNAPASRSRRRTHR